MNYESRLVHSYEQNLRRSGVLAENETIVGVEDCSHDYQKSGQVFWWKLNVELADGSRRMYALKCPYDTFGSGIEFFVRERAERSRMLRKAGISVPRIGVYDIGTFIHEFVEGTELDRSSRDSTPEQKQSFLEQREDIIRSCEKLGLVLMDNHGGNFIVNNEGKVVLLDLDFNQKI